MQRLSKEEYIHLIKDLPLPTEKQFKNFLEHVVVAHSWYKHLSLFEKYRFIVFLDPNVAKGFDEEHERIHHTWKTENEYRVKFGYLSYAWQNIKEEELNIDYQMNAVAKIEDGNIDFDILHENPLLYLPLELIVRFSFELSAFVYDHHEVISIQEHLYNLKDRIDELQYHPYQKEVLELFEENKHLYQEFSILIQNKFKEKKIIRKPSYDFLEKRNSYEEYDYEYDEWEYLDSLHFNEEIFQELTLLEKEFIHFLKRKSKIHQALSQLEKNRIKNGLDNLKDFLVNEVGFKAYNFFQEKTLNWPEAKIFSHNLLLYIKDFLSGGENRIKLLDKFDLYFDYNSEKKTSWISEFNSSGIFINLALADNEFKSLNEENALLFNDFFTEYYRVMYDSLLIELSKMSIASHKLKLNKGEMEGNYWTFKRKWFGKESTELRIIRHSLGIKIEIDASRNPTELLAGFSLNLIEPFLKIHEIKNKKDEIKVCCGLFLIGNIDELLKLFGGTYADKIIFEIESELKERYGNSNVYRLSYEKFLVINSLPDINVFLSHSERVVSHYERHCDDINTVRKNFNKTEVSLSVINFIFDSKIKKDFSDILKVATNRIENSIQFGNHRYLYYEMVSNQN